MERCNAAEVPGELQLKIVDDGEPDISSFNVLTTTYCATDELAVYGTIFDSGHMLSIHHDSGDQLHQIIATGLSPADELDLTAPPLCAVSRHLHDTPGIAYLLQTFHEPWRESSGRIPHTMHCSAYGSARFPQASNDRPAYIEIAIHCSMNAVNIWAAIGYAGRGITITRTYVHSQP